MVNTDISFGLMFYNEEQCIRRCLDSFVPYVKDFYAIDMGSTDASRSIVEEYTDRIYENKLEDETGEFNFAAARNFVKSKCKTKWLFSRDADEWINPEDQPLLEALIDSLDTQFEKFELIKVPRYNWVDADMTEETPVSGIRDAHGFIMRNLPHIVYKNKVHEVIFGARSEVLVKDFGINHGHFHKSEERRQRQHDIYAYFNAKAAGKI